MRHFEEFSNNVSIRTFIAKISMTIWGLPLISPTQDFGNRIWNQSLTIITSPSTMLKTVLVARGPRTPKGPCALQRCWSWKMVDKKLDVRLSLLGLTAGHKKRIKVKSCSTSFGKSPKKEPKGPIIGMLSSLKLKSCYARTRLLFPYLSQTFSSQFRIQ